MWKSTNKISMVALVLFTLDLTVVYTQCLQNRLSTTWQHEAATQINMMGKDIQTTTNSDLCSYKQQTACRMFTK